ncbi:MAG: hypothetical protein ACJAT2_000077 [Bacteriovoracaceae bacterium]|jgi:hypothetical protein
MKALKLSIIILLSFAAMNSYGAEQATLSTDLKIKGSSKKVKGPHHFSIGTGAYFGYVQQSLKLGRFINEKNLLQAVYSFHKNKDVKEIAEASTTGSMISVTNKFFFKDSFYLSAGAYYNKNEINVPEGKILRVKGTSFKEPVLENYGVGVSLGNHFFGSKGFSVGVDWIGYSTEVYKVQKIDGIKEGNLTLLNIAIGYNF